MREVAPWVNLCFNYKITETLEFLFTLNLSFSYANKPCFRIFFICTFTCLYQHCTFDSFWFLKISVPYLVKYKMEGEPMWGNCPFALLKYGKILICNFGTKFNIFLDLMGSSWPFRLVKSWKLLDFQSVSLHAPFCWIFVYFSSLL